MRKEKPAADSRVFVQTARPGRREELEAGVRQLFESLPAMQRLGAESRVLLKPNLLSKNAPEKAVTTHPDVVCAVILELQKRGVRDILVADSPGGPYSPGVMRAVYEACGIAAVCGETGAKMYTACESVRVESAGAGQAGTLVQQFQLLKPFADYDFIINLPKLKTHVLTGMSGAVKNLFGLVPGLEKAEFHMRFPQRERFARMLVDLCETVKADVHIVDGVTGMEGDGPGSGIPRVCGLLVGGENPYTIDLALCRYMGMQPMETPVLCAARQSGLCAEELEESLLLGSEEAKKPLPNFLPPRSYTGPMDFSSKAPGFLRPLVSAVAKRTAPRPVIQKPACIGCGKCAQICPQQVVALKKGKARIAYKSCIRCFCCHEICPVHAVDVKRSLLFKGR